MESDRIRSLYPHGSAAPPAGPDNLQCSRKGCGADAAWRIRWNNPRIHTPHHRKSWLACPDHCENLERFLRAQGFWKDTVPLGQGGPAGQDRP